MRTTVTLDSDVQLLVERRMRERGVPFKVALNDALRDGLAAATADPAAFTKPRDLGAPRLDLTRALGLADDLEDADVTRRLERRR